MNQKQQNRLMMNKTVSTVNKTNVAVWMGLKAFGFAQEALLASIFNRDKAAQTQSGTSTGTTLDKKQNTENAIDAVLKVARNTAAYAVSASDQALFASMNYSKSHFVNLPDNEQVASLAEIMKQVKVALPNLDNYGVTSENIMYADFLVKQIGDAITSPRDMIDAQSSATISVVNEEAASRKALSIMDRLIHNFSDDAADYVRQYRQARIIIDSGIRHEETPTVGGGDTPVV